MKEQRRGQLTQRIKTKSKNLIGYEITQAELRLMAHAQYVLTNSQQLNLQHIDENDREILLKWVEKGFVLSGVSKSFGRPLIGKVIRFKVTKCFWTAMSELVWLGYVSLNSNQ